MDSANNVVKKMQLLNTNKSPNIKDGDGDDGETYVDQIVVKRVDNGWMIAVVYEDEGESMFVFNVSDKNDGDKDAVKQIVESMGLESVIKFK